MIRPVNPPVRLHVCGPSLLRMVGNGTTVLTLDEMGDELLAGMIRAIDKMDMDGIGTPSEQVFRRYNRMVYAATLERRRWARKRT